MTDLIHGDNKGTGIQFPDVIIYKSNWTKGRFVIYLSNKLQGYQMTILFHQLLRDLGQNSWQTSLLRRILATKQLENGNKDA